MDALSGAIAANRFGMGARPGEIEAAASDPRGWLKAQIRPTALLVTAKGLKSAQDILKERADIYVRRTGAANKKKKKSAAPDGAMAGDLPAADQARLMQEMTQRDTIEGLAREVEARSRHAAQTPDSFAERWARFWANHFTVAVSNAQMIGLVGPFEREAVRRNAFGTLGGLLRAATFHPSMLVYLDANRSIGPSTRAAKSVKAGLNENLAREILELHTLGVGSGYTQADIVELAKALTGWTVGLGAVLAKFAGSASGKTVFAEPLHEPGARTVLGKTYRGAARLQAGLILDDLAIHPATARRVATRLARHFVADDPPASAIASLEDVFTRTRGDLSALARAVVDLDEAWRPSPAKFKTPEELLVSVARAASQESAFGSDRTRVYQSLGQPPFRAPSPAGWPDEATSWTGADAIHKRLDWANAVSRRIPKGVSPPDLLEIALGDLAGARTRESVSRAEDAVQGFTLTIMSPEFQRR